MGKELFGGLWLAPVLLLAVHLYACKWRATRGRSFLLSFLMDGLEGPRLSGGGRGCWHGLLVNRLRGGSWAALAADNLVVVVVSCSGCFGGGAVCLGIEEARHRLALVRRGHCQARSVLLICRPQRLLQTPSLTSKSA